MLIVAAIALLALFPSSFTFFNNSACHTLSGVSSDTLISLYEDDGALLTILLSDLTTAAVAVVVAIDLAACFSLFLSASSFFSILIR